MENKTYQYDEWIVEAKEKFGPDPKQWKFKCCNCGHEQSGQDFINANVKDFHNKVYFSCIGRWLQADGTISNGKSPCNYTIGGLLNLSHTNVITNGGQKIWVFEFGTPADKEVKNILHGE